MEQLATGLIGLSKQLKNRGFHRENRDFKPNMTGRFFVTNSVIDHY